MRKIERLTKNVERALKEKKIAIKNDWYEVENFINDALSYIKAVKEHRMLVGIMSVSKSGMTRRFVFTAFIPGKPHGNYRQYSNLFKTLGYSVNKENEIVVYGCGMNMVFATNYNVIHDFKMLGFLSEKECRKLSQMTPQYI